MSVKRWSLVCAVCLLLVSATACKFSFTTANISSLKLSKNKDASSTDSSFGPRDTIYAVAEVSNAPGKLKLKGRLLVDNIEGYQSGMVVPGAETTIDLPGSATGTFTFTPNAGGWPNGSYKVEVDMLTEDGEKKDQKTATFTVSGNTATAKPNAPAGTTPAQAPANTESDRTASGNSMGGFWTLTGEGTSGTPLTLGPWQLTLDEKGTELAGELDDGNGSTANVSGSRRGDSMTLTWGSGPAQFTLTGALDKSGELLSGDFTQAAGARGKWQAKKSS
ncbi:MAG TPA: hypothetical protein VF658_04140 [Pyrinomonadaceae bacterium]